MKMMKMKMMRDKNKREESRFSSLGKLFVLEKVKGKKKRFPLLIGFFSSPK